MDSGKGRLTQETLQSLSSRILLNPQLKIKPTTVFSFYLVNKGSSIKCTYCGESHYSALCTKFNTSQESNGILFRSGWCFNCLKTTHKSQEYRSTRTCQHCNRKHHQSICEQIYSVWSNPLNNNKASVKGSNHLFNQYLQCYQEPMNNSFGDSPCLSLCWIQWLSSSGMYTVWQRQSGIIHHREAAMPIES